jgi:hypothetical protein
MVRGVPSAPSGISASWRFAPFTRTQYSRRCHARPFGQRSKGSATMSDTALQEAKRRLILPALLHQLGLGHYAKKSARCPFHDDQRNSFSVFKGDGGAWYWKCWAGCGKGDEITFLEKHKGISKGEAIKIFREMAGCAPVTRYQQSAIGLSLRSPAWIYPPWHNCGT